MLFTNDSFASIMNLRGGKHGRSKKMKRDDVQYDEEFLRTLLLNDEIEHSVKNF